MLEDAVPAHDATPSGYSAVSAGFGYSSPLGDMSRAAPDATRSSESDHDDEQEEDVHRPEHYAAWLQEASRADPALFVKLIFGGEVAELVELMNGARRFVV